MAALKGMASLSRDKQTTRQGLSWYFGPNRVLLSCTQEIAYATVASVQRRFGEEIAYLVKESQPE
jgi:hypothetical protein